MQSMDTVFWKMCVHLTAVPAASHAADSRAAQALRPYSAASCTVKREETVKSPFP